MKTEAEIRINGMQVLIAALGLVEKEHFIAAISRNRFNYTDWRYHGLPVLPIEQLAQAANKFPSLNTLKNQGNLNNIMKN